MNATKAKELSEIVAKELVIKKRIEEETAANEFLKRVLEILIPEKCRKGLFELELNINVISYETLQLIKPKLQELGYLWKPIYGERVVISWE